MKKSEITHMCDMLTNWASDIDTVASALSASPNAQGRVSGMALRHIQEDIEASKKFIKQEYTETT